LVCRTIHRNHAV